jgi:hypothetical protein
VAREERDRGKRVKIGHRKIQINGEWFIWERKICRRRREEEKTNRREKV